MAQEMKIKVTAVSVGTGKTKAGKDYDYLDLDYRNLSFDNKAEAKKIMPFGAKEVFATLKNAQGGTVFTIQREKDDNGYWQWIGIAEGDVAIEQHAPQVGGGQPKAATPAPKSTFETPEERAKKQVYIVRQSSISEAIDTLKTDKKAPTTAEVLAVAKEYEAFVFGIDAAPTANKLPELEDEDIPM